MPLGRPIYRAVCASDKKTIRLANREMLIALIQSKWDRGPKMVLGPCLPLPTYLRQTNGRADNMKS
jgi:hypothetical protein